MPFLPRARDWRPWPVRAAFAIAVLAGALIGLPEASAKRWDDQLSKLTVPAKPSQGEKPEKTGDTNKAELPKLPKVPKVSLPSLPAPKITPPSLPVASPAVPSVARVEPVKTTQPAPAATVPATSRGSSGSVGRAGAGSSSQSAPISSPLASAPRGSVNPAAGRPQSRRQARHTAAKPATRRPASRRPTSQPKTDSGSSVTRTVRDIVEVVPGSVQATLAALACLSAVLGGGYLLSLIRARRLARHRGELLQEVGLLQAALLPSVPDVLGAVRPSVAYRPAAGLAAGGDFYDAVDLGDGRAGFILGDVSGHGREALERTAFARYTLRAFLEAGLEPRVALQVAARVLGEHLGGEFVTVLLAIHDPADGSLTWSSAGHPAPIVLGRERFEPVTAGSSPPIGMGLETGLRQTTIPLPAGSIACMYTDGLVEARSDGDFLGRRGLEEILIELGDEGTAAALIELVSARSADASDDMAACLLTPAGDGPATAFRREELVVSAADIERGVAARFLAACRAPDLAAALEEAGAVASTQDCAVVSVTFGERRTVEVSPREAFDEERAEAASRRMAAA